MTQTELEALLLLEIHRVVVNASSMAITKLGRTVPPAALDGYITAGDIAALQDTNMADFENPSVRKSMEAAIARNEFLSYPPDGKITENDATALASLQLNENQRSVVERVISEACHTAFFHLFCLMDSVEDPKLTQLNHWGGARFMYSRKEGPMLHDEIGNAYYEFRKRAAG
jgi:hypothetical protein